ncbi:Hypothetical_protein [Hexamita inflata]|uniref:Hypothetical_protein n=1 Tax=Hexamita inflata TaxID=28002 RepID=A0ABP1GL01_9EUKA
MFSNYDIKTYLSCRSFYEPTVKDDEDSEEESNSEQESEDEILSEPDENSQIEDSTIDFAPVPGPKIVDETKPSSVTAQLVNEFLLMVEKLFIRHMPDFSILSLDESLIPCKCKCCHNVYMPQKPHKYGTLDYNYYTIEPPNVSFLTYVKDSQRFSRQSTRQTHVTLLFQLK